MKNFRLLLLASSVSLLSCAQNLPESRVPAVVINAFKAKYPRATDVEWEKKGPHYEVEFETGVKGRDHKLGLDSTGAILFHKQDISRADLPAAVMQAIEKNFPGWRTDDPEKTERNGVISYQVEVKRQGEEWEVSFDPEGNILDKRPD
jgi:uncharacterized membrane protein YkoI